MREKARAYLLSIGYDEASVEETIANATEEELRELVPTDVPKPKLKQNPPKRKPVPKPKPRRNPNPPEYKRPEKLKLGPNMVDIPIEPKFDPVAAAMDIVSEAKRQESKPPIKYVVTPCYKLTICSDVDVETMNAVKAELKARGGKWSPELEGFVFDTDPETLL